MILYNKVNSFLKAKYSRRVQRIPISTGLGCPNREEKNGKQGCIFCDPSGSGFAALRPDVPIREQISFYRQKFNLRFHSPLYFIAYYQSFSNTYAPMEQLKRLFDPVLEFEDIIILDVSTRPDVLPFEVLDLLQSYSQYLDVFVEIGLQSANTVTLDILRRGHSLEQWADAVLRCKARGFQVIAHVILDLPWDQRADVLKAAALFNDLHIDGVKCHSLYVVEGTELSRMVKEKETQLLTQEEYIDRSILFLENLDPEIVIHRLASDPPKEGAYGNWGVSKIHLIQKLEEEMVRRATWQGRKRSASSSSQTYML